MNDIKEMKAEEFIRRLRNLMKNHEDSKFVFFLGAGCSISSGIPGAARLVRQWLPRLKEVKTGDNEGIELWVQDKYPEYTEGKESLLYGKVIEDLFLTSEERQREIERLTEGKDPGFGYAVLAQLMTHVICGRNCNVVITVNFDDLIADALYLYTQKKPLVISHESLAGFVRITRTRPLVIKLHGDARLEPKNTELETQELAENVRRVIKNLLRETGLIFIGYGGHDASIAEILNELPSDALPWGVYWVGNTIPDGKTGEWLRKRNAFWVNQNDFDELMLLMWNEFGFSHPEKDRFDRLWDTYFETFKKLSKRVDDRLRKEEVKPLREALEKAIQEFGSWWEVFLEAEKYKKKDPERANSIYKEGVKEFSNNAGLFGSYAVFLHEIRKDYDTAEKYYKKALEIEPEHAAILGNYAVFLKNIRKDYDTAEKYYKKALDIDSDRATTLSNYASFLEDIRKDHDTAEEYYKKALEIEPDNTTILGNYALFLEDIRKDYDTAEKYYKKALEIEPEHANNLCNYAVFLKNIRKDHDTAEEYYKKALEIEPDNTTILSNYAVFLQNIRKDYDTAEEYYKKALEIEPENAIKLGNYAGFLLARNNKKGFLFLQETLEIAKKDASLKDLLLECLFYQYAHSKDESARNNSLKELNSLLQNNARSQGFDLSDNVKRALKDGHPHPEFLKTLAKVISDKCDIQKLEPFDPWHNITHT